MGAMKNLGEAIKGLLLQKPWLRNGLRTWTTSSLWNEIVGPEIAQHSRIVSFYRGRMVVLVPSGPWAQELTLNRDRIREDLNTAAATAGGAKVENLVFKVGTINNPPPTAGQPDRVEESSTEDIYYASSWDDDFMATLEKKAVHDPIARRVLDVLTMEKSRLKKIKKAGGRCCAVCGVWHTGRNEECLPCRVLRQAGFNGGGD